MSINFQFEGESYDVELVRITEKELYRVADSLELDVERGVFKLNEEVVATFDVQIITKDEYVDKLRESRIDVRSLINEEIKFFDPDKLSPEEKSILLKELENARSIAKQFEMAKKPMEPKDDRELFILPEAYEIGLFTKVNNGMIELAGQGYARQFVKIGENITFKADADWPTIAGFTVNGVPFPFCLQFMAKAGMSFTFRPIYCLSGRDGVALAGDWTWIEGLCTLDEKIEY